MRQPDSARGKREGLVLDPPEMPIPPEWLPENVRVEFDLLVDGLTASLVPTKPIDGFAVAMLAMCVAAIKEWTLAQQQASTIKERLACARMVQTYQRDSIAWLGLCCACPTARARIGVRSTPKKTGPLAALLATNLAMMSAGIE